MAQGDTVQGLQSVVANGVLDIKPTTGQEWIIHNIYYNQGVVEFYKTDGTNLLIFESDSSRGARLGTVFHVTETQWIRIKNLATTSTLIGFDGIQSK